MRRIAAAAVAIVAVAGCGSSGGDQAGTSPAARDPEPTAPTTAAGPSPTPATTTAPTRRTAKAGVRVRTGSSEFGTMLFDGTGQAIYLFDKERTSRAECYGDCAVAWPPVLTEGQPVLAGAVRPALIGTTRRTDGSTQVTYGGHPPYYYAHEGPNQVLCHRVDEFGGRWLVVRPDGRPAP